MQEVRRPEWPFIGFRAEEMLRKQPGDDPAVPQYVICVAPSFSLGNLPQPVFADIHKPSFQPRDSVIAYSGPSQAVLAWSSKAHTPTYD